MTNLAQGKCAPCSGEEPRATPEEIAEYKKQIPDWEIVGSDGVQKLQRAFEFPDFAKALEFTNKVGEIAEAQDHHPAILTEYGKVTVTWWTHKIKGLHSNDFIMAAKTDQLAK
jgi:4a-hydroxytetrahydrobiopterin dehydratase